MDRGNRALWFLTSLLLAGTSSCATNPHRSVTLRWYKLVSRPQATYPAPKLVDWRRARVHIRPQAWTSSVSASDRTAVASVLEESGLPRFGMQVVALEETYLPESCISPVRAAGLVEMNTPDGLNRAISTLYHPLFLQRCSVSDLSVGLRAVPSPAIRSAGYARRTGPLTRT